MNERNKLPPPEFSPDQIRDISEKLYRARIDSECGNGTAKMTDDAIERRRLWLEVNEGVEETPEMIKDAIKNGDLDPRGKPHMTIRDRAGGYDKTTRWYLKTLQVSLEELQQKGILS